MFDLVVALVVSTVFLVAVIIISCCITSDTDRSPPPPLPRPGQLRMPVYKTKYEDSTGAGTAISLAGTDSYGGSGGGCRDDGGGGILTSDTKLPSPPSPSSLPPRTVQRPMTVSRTKDRDVIGTGTAMLLATAYLNSGSASAGGCSNGGGGGGSCGDGGGGGGGGGCGGGGE